MITRQQIKQARTALIRTARGEQVGRRPGLLSYKELWEIISDEPWSQANTRKVVKCVSKISTEELAQGRPPLNELVVRTNQREPKEPWRSIKQHHQKEYGVEVPYRSHREAQEACWRYWSEHSLRSGGTVVRKQSHPQAAEEGMAQDKNVTFRSRNRQIVEERKTKDKHTCQACGYKAQVNGQFIVDCHHKYPLGLRTDIAVTDVEDLVCLCPSCHRIAHTRVFPLSITEIREAIEK